jgi:DNA-binding SARP family transcriptional activator
VGKLAISLFGPLRVTLDGAPVSSFESDKVRALLIYLVVEGRRPQARQKLAGLLWPERPEGLARRNLSQALYSLREVLGDGEAENTPLLSSTSEAIQLNPANEHWLDATEFTQLLADCDRHSHHLLEACGACLERLQQAVSLYQGEFLEGFSLRDSPPSKNGPWSSASVSGNPPGGRLPAW